MKQELDRAAPVAAEDGSDELNRWLGRREAFSLVAGHCSAADVECIKRIRDGKLYLKQAKDWGEFCEKELHMSKSNANRLIGLRDKLGDSYFYIAQMMRISPTDYGAVAPAVSERGIEFNGEVIPLVPENNKRIAAAVTALKAVAVTRSEPTFQDRVDSLDAAADRLLQQFRDLHKGPGKADPHLANSVATLREKVGRLLLDFVQ